MSDPTHEHTLSHLAPDTSLGECLFELHPEIDWKEPSVCVYPQTKDSRCLTPNMKST